MTFTLPFVEIQDLTFTAKQLGHEDISITYLNGGIAEAEVVTVSGHSIFVRIASGTSIADDIADAIEASVAASALVTVEVTGTGSNPQFTCVNASLSGGTPAVAARKVIGSLRYTAKVAGVAGNDITIVYVEDNETEEPAVVVNSTDIEVTFPSGTTALEIKEAIEAESAADDLVAVTSAGPASSTVQTEAMAPEPVNLVGGLDANEAATEVQDLTFSADVIGTADNGRTITMIGGGTAGSEEVTVDVDGNVLIEMENGVSTAQEIKDACDAEADFNGVAASGTLTIGDYQLISLKPATGSLTVANYALLIEASATATITVVDYQALAGAVLTVNGTALTEGVEWTAATDNDTTAASLELAVEAVTGISSTASTNVITATVTTPGTAGNAFTLATSDAVNLTISGALFTGGRNYGTVVVNGVTLTAVAAAPSSVQFVPEVSNDQTATNLEVAVEAVTGISSSVTDNIITITAETPGAAGNSITLVVSGSNSGVTRSGATLTGGQDSQTFTVDDEVFTFVPSGATGNEIDAETDEATTAANAATVISSVLTGVATAVADAAVVTITADAVDSSGNEIVLSKVGDDLTVSGEGFLEGGLDGLNCEVSGTAGTAQVTVNAEHPAGAEGVGPDSFFRDQTDAATASYVFQPFGFGANRLSVYNDETSGTDTLDLSLDGVTPFMVLSPTEKIENFEIQGRITGLYVKYVNAAPNFRILASGL